MGVPFLFKTDSARGSRMQGSFFGSDLSTHMKLRTGEITAAFALSALARICSLGVTGASSSLIPKPCPVSDAAASPGCLV